MALGVGCSGGVEVEGDVVEVADVRWGRAERGCCDSDGVVMVAIAASVGGGSCGQGSRDIDRAARRPDLASQAIPIQTSDIAMVQCVPERATSPGTGCTDSSDPGRRAQGIYTRKEATLLKIERDRS